MKTVQVEIPMSYPNQNYWILRIIYGDIGIRTYKDPIVRFDNNDDRKESLDGANDNEKAIGSLLKSLTDGGIKVIRSVEFSYAGIMIKKYDTRNWNQAGPILVKALKKFFKEKMSVEIIFPPEIKDWG